MEVAAGGPSPESAAPEAGERLQVIHATIDASELSDHVKLMGKAWASDHVFGLTVSDPAGGFITIPNFIRKVESAVSSKNTKDALSSQRKGDSALHIACFCSDDRAVIVKSLLDVLPDTVAVNARSPLDGATPLMRCCEAGSVNCAKLLVERGADVNAMDAKGICVLHYAMQSSEYDMAIWLQSVGAKRCSGRCNRCALFLKMVDRRRVIKLAEEAAAKAPAVVSRPPGTKEPSEATQRVLQEEFEGVDLSAEIAKLMAEEASTGHSMFAPKAATPSEPPAGAADMGLRSILEHFGESQELENAAQTKLKKNKKKKKRK